MADKIRLKITVDCRRSAVKSERYCVEDEADGDGPRWVGQGATMVEAIGNWVVSNAERHQIRLIKDVKRVR